MPNKIGTDVIKRKGTLRKRNTRRKISAEDLQVQIRNIAEHLKRNPKNIDERTKKELRGLLINIEKSSREANPSLSEKAQKWASLIEKGINLSADIVQLFTFLSGIPSLPTLGQVLIIAKRIVDSPGTKTKQFSYRTRKRGLPPEVSYI